MSRIKADAACDFVLLVILDNATLDAREMWEAPFSAVLERLSLGGKSRDRGALGIAEFKAIARRVWPESKPVKERIVHMCPECQHQFLGKGFDGIDAHWRSKHEEIMPYSEAWPLIKSGSYRSLGAKY
jgi:hypothetical protein